MRTTPRTDGTDRPPNRRRTRPGVRTTMVLSAALLLTTLVPAGAEAVPATTAASTVSGTDGAGVHQPGSRQHGRGTLLSAERLYTLATPRDVAAELDSAGFDSGMTRHGVDAYRLEYRTVDPHGRPTTASGLLVLPRDHQGRLRPVSFGHGTGSHREDAPSMQRHGFLPSPALTYASAGFAAVAADYLGMGTGPGPHPWMDIPSETTASLDMLRAARAFAFRTGHVLEREVVATGFSQGASAALGLARALQSGEDPWFRLGALAPVSGAYDFRGAELPALLSGELQPKSSVIYTAYLLVAYNRLHHLYDQPEEVFQETYAGGIEELFDGEHTGQQLMEGTPDTLDDLLTAHGRDLLSHPTGNLAEALRVTDSVCTDWAPRVPTRLYWATGDDEAAVANTEHCEAAMRAHGVPVRTVNVGPVDYQGSRHLGSQVAATARIVRWLSQWD